MEGEGSLKALRLICFLWERLGIFTGDNVERRIVETFLKPSAEISNGSFVISLMKP